MKACLLITDMFCKREKANVLRIIQQNDKSTQKQSTLLFVQFNIKYLRYYNVFVMLSHLTVHTGQIAMPFQVTPGQVMLR